VRDAESVARDMEAYLGSQADRYRRVLALCTKQNKCIADADTDGLMEILSAKQALIAKEQKAGKEAEALLASWESCRDSLPAERRAAVEARHEEVKQVLAQVISEEEKGQETISRKTSDQSRNIANLQKGKQMLKAYGARPGSQGGRFTDKKK
jgi:fructose-1-phosphate kinase PfkB-like protein